MSGVCRSIIAAHGSQIIIPISAVFTEYVPLELRMLGGGEQESLSLYQM